MRGAQGLGRAAPHKLILITRLRRMGKSLNLDTLRTFLDFKADTPQLAEIFKLLPNTELFGKRLEEAVSIINYRTRVRDSDFMSLPGVIQDSSHS